MKPSKIVLPLFLAATTSTAFAQSDIDANGDGVLTLAEVQAVYMETSETDFIAADSDESGTLDMDELAAAREAGLIPAE